MIQTRHLLLITCILSAAFFLNAETVAPTDSVASIESPAPEEATATATAPALASPPEVFAFEVPNYAEAKRSKNFLRFDMSAKILYFFKNNFSGFVKKLSVSGDFVDSQLRSAVLTFDAKALDTNIQLRNKKIFKQSLDSEKFPTVKVRLLQPIQLNGAQTTTPGTVEVRGLSHPINIQFVTKETPATYVVEGEAVLSLTQLGVPNPSNFFAKLDDKIALVFHFDVNKKK